MTRLACRAAALILLFFATPGWGQRSNRRVIDASAIAAAGWHRVGDIAAALPPGSAASLDGFNHELRGSRLGFSATTRVPANWIVRLDGQVMPMRIGGLWILDAMPVAITQLDSIVIVEGPALTSGRAAMLGAIDLYTRRPPRGPSVTADYQHGDESGDPGPYRYTSRATPNVEKLGPFTSGAAAIAGKTASVDLAARYASLNITDERLVSRLGPLFPFIQTDVNASGGSGVATIDALGGRQLALGGRGRFTGFMETPASPGPQQARLVTTHGGVSGDLGPAGREIQYAVGATRLEVQSMRTQLVTPPQERDLFDGLIEAPIARGLRAGIGGSFGRQATGTRTREESSTRGWLAFERGGRSVDAALERSAGRLRVSGGGRLERVLGDSDLVALSATALSAWRGADHEWMETPASSFDSGGMNVLEVRAELTTRGVRAIRPTWYVRGFAASGVGTDPSVDFGAGTVDRPVKYFGAGVVAETPPGARVTARLRGEVTQMVGDANVAEKSTPAGFAEGSLAARAPGGFRLAASGRFAPATRWAAVGDVPATRRLDVSVNKTMWRDRARAQLVLRNALNTAERTHPGGAQWNLRTHLAVTIALPGGAKP